MDEPKFKIGQVVYHTRCIERSGEVYAIHRGPREEWAYKIDEGHGRDEGVGGYPEHVLSSEKIAEPPKPKLHYKVNIGSLDAWHNEAALLLPPEEGGGFQPTVDLFNHITAHREGLIRAIEQFCQKVGIESPIVFHDSSEGRKDGRA